jgi:predicted DNA-binding mobile mystery protein A
MVTSYEQLDKKLKTLRPLADTTRPAKGWVRAIRDTLGMTTKQLGQRMGVSQPRIIKLEKAEANGTITLDSLERAAAALGCRVVYALVPEKPLAEMLDERALKIAGQHLASVDQTMRLEAQGVSDPKVRDDIVKKFVAELMRKPARLWDDP